MAYFETNGRTYKRTRLGGTWRINDDDPQNDDPQNDDPQNDDPQNDDPQNDDPDAPTIEELDTDEDINN